MKCENKTREQLLHETKKLRKRITELKIAKNDDTFTKESLKESEEKAQTLINATTDFVTLIDPEGTILVLNEVVCKSLGRGSDELIGLCIYDFDSSVPADVVAKRKEFVNQVVSSKKPVFVEDEFKGRHLDIRIHPVFNAHGKVDQIAVFSRDITERKRSEQKLIEYQNQLRSLTSQLILTEEQERRRIATELHDRIGQALSIAYIKIGSMRQTLSAVGREWEADDIRALIEQTIEDTHSLTFDLCPRIFYELGFEKALECLADEFQQQHGLKTLFESDAKPKPLEDDVTILLFRTVRELLINIVKHAQARNAQVSVKRKKDTVHITVADDGIGFSPEAVHHMLAKKGGFGLFSIQERLHFLGGEMLIKSAPGKGTMVTLTIPLTGRGKEVKG